MFIRKFFKRERKPSTSNQTGTINLIVDKRDKYLKGEIIIGHCRGHATIILFFHIKGFYKQNVRFLSENYYFR